MKSALVLSPFATAPLDAGHRRRVFQTTQMLRAQGYRITFLLYAFEDTWLWKVQNDFVDTLKSQWDEVIVFTGDQKPGAPPQFGPDHQLDEWWNALLEQFLENLFKRRFFDLFVVHNVWLSKAFDCAPRSTIKMLETHDIFCRRRALLTNYGISSDFFMPDEASEMFGINRADIAVTIQEEEARFLLGKVNAQVVTIPFYDTALETQAKDVARTDYLFKNKVVFGFLGSRHIFNVRGLQALADELERLIGETYAPVDIVVGGNAAEALYTRLPIKRLGRVDSEVDVYKVCDIAIAPAFAGTGFKVKVGDCLALRMPLLCAAHSAIGTSLPDEAVFETPADMARAMVAISLTRPPLAALREEVSRARQDLKRRATLGMGNFDRLARRVKTALVLEARALTVKEHLLGLYSLVSCTRDIGQERPVYLIVNEAIAKEIGPVLPPGTMVMSPGAETDSLLSQLPKIVVDASGLGEAALFVGKQDGYVADTRWNWAGVADVVFDPGSKGLRLPYFHDYHRWEPAAERLKRAWQRANHETHHSVNGVEVLVFRDGDGMSAVAQRITLQRTFLLIDVADTALVTAAILYILEMPAETLEILCATTNPGIRDAVIAASQHSRQKFTGTLDGVFKISFPEVSQSAKPRPVPEVPEPVAQPITEIVTESAAPKTASPAKAPSPFTRHVSMDRLIILEQEDFVKACYREILGKLADRDGLMHYLYELDRGVSKEHIMRHLANDPEALERNVELLPLTAVAA